MGKFRKKPVEIEAVQWTGNLEEMENFLTVDVTITLTGEIVIPTLEGKMKGNIGDWIIKGINGEFYPCKPDIFEKTYDKI